MRNIKLILPMLAFVLAVGMSFAFTSEAPGDLVIQIDGVFYESPINCTAGELDCTTWISQDGNELKVQVLREISPGNYVEEKTDAPSEMVFPFSSLTPVNQ